MVKAEWFAEWFDSPYYHILYKNRDESEAERFIDHLLNTLSPPPGSHMLDLACGKGRYSRHLASKGYKVTGLDLSKKSIDFARQFGHERLHFYTHDMRQPFQESAFDYIFNFFTSFGYFEEEAEDLQTLNSVAHSLKPEGTFVLDFFNTHYVRQRLTGHEHRKIGDLSFDLHKRLDGKHVIKTIQFADGHKNYYFEERVRLFELSDFERLFAAAGLHILRTYGDYQLQPYNWMESPRLILVANLSNP
ncbi:MAG: methyltransferase domain-containing protein [Phaeodactylibacter sp.]|uniref:SAM-dependent methyltransferase n=1 Tax=Phaeodactylibacter sp. TaxID=1940289 RepID=UPI0032EABB10